MGHPLDAATRAFMEPRFGHDFSQVRVHADAHAAYAAEAVEAHAFTTNRDIVFGAGQYAPQTESGRRLLSHELTHVIQQQRGVPLAAGVGPANDAYERQANAVAGRVAQGCSAGHLLAPHPGSGSGAPGLQRFAFVNEKQVDKSEKDLTPEMRVFVADKIIRNYTGLDELNLGNLADGTWMRFSDTGINLLGENHTHVTLEQVVPAVGSKSFIYEQFSSDVMTPGSKLQQAYERENQELYKQFGVDKEKDKQPFGAESLFPKMGFGLTLAIPYFEGKLPMSQLGMTGYVGQPVQRYLKIAWGHSKDNKQAVELKKKTKEKVPPRAEALATVHASVEGKLDKFILSLVVDGFIGDELVKKENAGLLAPLAEFTRAFTEAMVEMATTDKSSRLSDSERKAFSGAKSTGEKDKMNLFSNWRNFRFEDNVNAAAKNGVRYAGMGQAHLDYLLRVGLPKNAHPFEMDGKDIAAFKALTQKLKKVAKEP
jgi:hypothetical protein